MHSSIKECMDWDPLWAEQMRQDDQRINVAVNAMSLSRSSYSHVWPYCHAKNLLVDEETHLHLESLLLPSSPGEDCTRGDILKWCAVRELRKPMTSVQLLTGSGVNEMVRPCSGQPIDGAWQSPVCVLESVSCLHTTRFHRVKSYALWVPVISECCRCPRPLRFCRTSSSSATAPGIPHAQLRDRPYQSGPAACTAGQLILQA